MTQQEKILAILRECGERGMNSYEWRMTFIQLPVRIKELKEMGHKIASVPQKNRSVNYILVYDAAPSSLLKKVKKEEKTQSKGFDGVENVDWQWDFSTGIARKVLLQPIQEGIFA